MNLCWAVSFAVLAGFYLLFAGTVSLDEGVASVLCAAVTLAMTVAEWRHGRRFARRAPWLRLLVRTAAAVPADAWQVARCLALAQPGHLVHARFRAAGDTPVSATRRALAVLSASLPPASFVVRVEDQALLLHRMGKDRPTDPDWVVPLATPAWRGGNRGPSLPAQGPGPGTLIK